MDLNMLPKNIPLYKLDLTGKNPNNLIAQEYYQRLDVEHDLVFILRSGPFYTESLSLYTPEGTVLVENEDYEILGIAQALTAFVKDKEVSMMIIIKNSKLTEFFADYQVVGHFSLLNKDIVDLVNSAIEDDRPVKWSNIKGKPKWFVPELHQHDLRYEIHSFQDLIDCIKRIKDVKAILPNRELVSIDQFQSVIYSRIDEYEKRLLEYIKKHDSDNTPPYTNSHGLTAKQVGLEKVDNFETATLLDILDGFRRDLHVTADNVKSVIDSYGKETDNLVKSGSLPILKYGSTSFIPSPINGSYEGMGGDDFYIGNNIESNGEALALTPRNDGKVNGLYFMQNLKSGHPSDSWKFTSYRYSHQTADADGVKLTRILRGSNGKLLIIGGPNTSGKTVWYWALGNGTFDPLKHKLEKLPDEMQNINTWAYLCSSAFPEKVFLFDIIDGATAYNDKNIRDIAFSFPIDNYETEIVNKGVIVATGFVGLYCWEFEVATKTWRKVTFNYNQAIIDKAVKSQAWIPWKFIVEAVDGDNVRADGREYKYGLKQAEYVFSKLITLWNLRLWYNQGLDKYDKENDRLALKHMYVSYGQDERTALFEGMVSSCGIILKNRSLINNVLTYDVENRKSLTEATYFDTTVVGTPITSSTATTGKNDHREWAGKGYQGALTMNWLNNGKIFYFGTRNFSTYPTDIVTSDLNGTASFEDIEKFVDNRFDEETTAEAGVKNSAIVYNENNPASLTIGAHSTFWLQLDPNKSDTMGSVSYGSSKQAAEQGVLLWRKQPALDGNGYPIKPDVAYNLYSDGAGKNRVTYGYALNNDTKILNNHPGYVYCSNIFINDPNNRKNEYWKNLIAHHAFNGEETTVGNSDANTNFDAEFKLVYDKESIEISVVKTYDLKDQINNILIPKLKSYLDTLSNSTDLFTGNMLQTHRIMFTNLPSTKYDKFLIFSASFINKTNGLLSSAAVAFNLTGGTLDSASGLIKGATVTTVGNVKTCNHVYLVEQYWNTYTSENYRCARTFTLQYTQSRDLVMQLSAGKSLVIAQMSQGYQVKGNRHEPGYKFIVDETGIVEMGEGSVYYTAGQYTFFLHPYYGICRRVTSPGPSEVGYALVKPTSLNFSYESPNFTLGNSNYLEGAFTIYFTVEQEILLNGRPYKLDSGIKNLTEVISNPRNRTFYIYLDYNAGGPFYNISLSPLPETSSRALLSVVKTNNDSIYEIENYNVFTMNGIRISAIRHGSVIPAASGTIEESGQLENWVTQNRG